MKPSILFAASSVAATNNLVPVIRRVMDDGFADTLVIAQSTASDIFKREAITANTITRPVVKKEDIADISMMSADVKDILDKHHFDLLVSGQTGTVDSVSITDAALSLTHCPALVMQDWGGHIAPTTRTAPTTYLCVSTDALESTQAQKANGILVGTPAHDIYRDLPYTELRRTIRAAHDDKTIIGFFGQYLTEHPEYLSLIETLAHSVNKPAHHLIYRPHPTERTRGEGDVEKTSAIFDRVIGPEQWSIDTNDTQTALAVGCHIATGYCPSSFKDIAAMNGYAPFPLAAPIALMWDKTLNERLGVSGYPELENGAGLLPSSPDKLTHAMHSATHPDLQTNRWHHARRALPQGESSATQNVVSAIKSALTL